MRIKLALAAFLLFPALLSAQEQLTPAIIIDGASKEKYLLRPGAKLFGGQGIITSSFRNGSIEGRELGAVVKAKKPFLVKDILISVHSNHIPGYVASIIFYRIEGKEETFVNVLHKPITFDVAVSNEPQHFDIKPEESVLLEPGKYFIAYQTVDYDAEALQAFLAKPEDEREYWEMSIDFNVHLKSSYLREAALGKMEPFPVNIGIAVKGLEFQ